MRHALRLTQAISLALWRLHEAGPAGLAFDLCPYAGLLEAWGMGEFFTDESRILCSRIRATTSGDRVAMTLIATRKDAM